MRMLLSVLALAHLAGPALADESGWPDVVLIPVECAQYGTIPGGHDSPLAWDYVVSFASCLQDATIPTTTTIAEAETVAERLQIALAPSAYFLVATVEQAPRSSKLRAAYYIALGQLTLITRARASVAADAPELRARLEPLLEPHARTAWDYFSMIGSIPKRDAVLAGDPVLQSMVRTSRSYAAALDQAWRFSAALSVTAMP